MNKISIRLETTVDYEAVETVIEEAFRNEEYSDHKEQFLVERLRQSEAFIPELSLVAQTTDGEIVGHILLTKITIDGIYPSLALAPVSVKPEFQHQRIGFMLIESAHSKAKEIGYGSVILLGHQDYYPRFGYMQLSNYGIRLPFDVPDENCMAIELQPGALKGIHGTVVYPDAFLQ